VANPIQQHPQQNQILLSQKMNPGIMVSNKRNGNI
jgi:hypothetical protein